MFKNFKAHFEKHNKLYSYAVLLIIAILVAWLFVRVDILERELTGQLEGNISRFRQLLDAQ